MIFCVACWIAPLAAAAHDSRPLAIIVTETANGITEVKWAAPPSLDPAFAPEIRLSHPCQPRGPEATAYSKTGHRFFICPDGLSDAELQLHYSRFNPSLSAVVTLALANGETRSALLDPTQTTWRPSLGSSGQSNVAEYFSMGTRHILSGIDHLLFLLCLVIVAGTLERTIIAVSGFTLAHSITLFLVSTGRLHLSIPAIEAVIALSIVFLAAEIARGPRSTLAWERPAIVALLFGLAHGAGFGSALQEYGLPQAHALAALFFFNLGVEAGQFAVLAAALLAFWLATRTSPLFAREILSGRLQSKFVYGIGVAASLWFYQGALSN